MPKSPTLDFDALTNLAKATTDEIVDAAAKAGEKLPVWNGQSVVHVSPKSNTPTPPAPSNAEIEVLELIASAFAARKADG